MREKESKGENEGGKREDDGDTLTVFCEETSIWLLDFNQIRPLPEFPFSVCERSGPAAGQKKQDLDQQQGKYYEAARREQWLDLTLCAFFGNDPYLPQPDDDGIGGLWHAFGEAYAENVWVAVKGSEIEQNSSTADNVLVQDMDNERVAENLTLARKFMTRVQEECLRKEQRVEQAREAAMEDWTSARHC